ncbi:MAG: CHASE3 domain-containing protein, partial [Mycolicibacterium aromaticivorans]|nr:CHASE3 domain-containing protein [Mycolicibacterium aromaticivorans]
MKEVAGTRLSRMTVRGWLTLVLLVLGIVVLGGALVAGVLLNRTDETSRQLIDDIQPARVAAYRLQAALRDQETAVRGYVIAADPQFLSPYADGQRAEQSAAQTIRRQLAGRPELLADLDAIENSAAAWRSEYADPLIVGVTPGSPSVLTKTTAEAGKAKFDSLRALFDAQNEHLATARTDAVKELDAARAWRDRASAV